MPKIERLPDQDFWSDVYRGHQIAVFNHHGRWHAYLDHMIQAKAVFATDWDGTTKVVARSDGTLTVRRAHIQ